MIKKYRSAFIAAYALIILAGVIWHAGGASAQDTIKLKVNSHTTSTATMSNMKPGDQMRSDYTIINEGNEDFDYYVDFKFKSGDVELYKILQMTLEKGGVILYSGVMSEAPGRVAVGSLAGGGQEAIIMDVTFPWEAGNEYQGKQTTVAFEFTASGTPEPTASPEPSTGPSPTPSATASPEPSVEPSTGPTPTASPEPSTGPSPTPSATASPEPSVEPSTGPTPTASPEPSTGPSPTPSATASPEPSVEPSTGPTPTASPEPSTGPSPTPSATASPEPSAGPSAEPTASATNQPTSGPPTLPTATASPGIPGVIVTPGPSVAPTPTATPGPRDIIITDDAVPLGGGDQSGGTAPEVSPGAGITAGSTAKPAPTPTSSPGNDITLADDELPLAAPDAGDKLPDTAEPWYNLILISLAVAVISVIVLRRLRSKG
ncbi:hypothetical protein ACFRAM_15295 [Paenibacillus sp. NPDC056722]|uniref:hypothetical protein n=1 Tax=Paenibacillus sp. NPDC056722 TaxID=3345924 RepID=UPI0036BA4148